MGAFGGLFHLGQAVEAPPAQYASGPTQTGKTYQLDLNDPFAVDYLCQTYNRGLPQNAAAGTYYQGCYNPRMDAVIVPAQGAWPSEAERQQLIAHEWAHARGQRHNADGEGVNWAHSLPPVGWVNQVTGRPTPPPEAGNPAPVFVGPAPPADAISGWGLSQTKTTGR